MLDSVLGSSLKVGSSQRRLAWTLRKDDTLKSGSVMNVVFSWLLSVSLFLLLLLSAFSFVLDLALVYFHKYYFSVGNLSMAGTAGSYVVGLFAGGGRVFTL